MPADRTQRALRAAYGSHPRNWRRNRYVYPVCSRRSGGLSIGVNLNPEKACNFDCIYCQVSRGPSVGRAAGAPAPPVDLEVLRAELAEMLVAAGAGLPAAAAEVADAPKPLWRRRAAALAEEARPPKRAFGLRSRSGYFGEGGSGAQADRQGRGPGRLLDEPEFRDLPDDLRRVRDIAFSGDGEPTACRRFADAVEIADELAVAAGVDAKLVLMTNATLFGRPAVRRGLALLHRRAGEIWGKLETGTEAHYRRIARTKIPFARVLANLRWAAARWPIVIQSCFMRLDGEGPGSAEIEAYCDRLAEILAAGGRIRRVQVYTIARPPAEAFVTPLDRRQVDDIVRAVRVRLPQLAVEPFYGPD